MARLEKLPQHRIDEALLRYMRTLRVGADFSSDLLDTFERRMNDDAPTVGAIHERVPVDGYGTDSTVTVDVVVPRGAGPHPVLLWLHGGGWVSGSARTHRRLACELASRGLLVFNVDYRRAPRHRFPAAVDDCSHALRWVATVASSFGGQAEPIVVGGDSAGGNLAAVTMAGAKAVDGILAGGILAYPIVDVHRALPIISDVVGGPDPQDQLYLPVDRFEELRGDPRVCPERSAADLPPVLLIVGSDDPLIGETHAMARALAHAGTPHELLVLDGAPHGLLQLHFLGETHDKALDAAAQFVHRRTRWGTTGRDERTSGGPTS